MEIIWALGFASQNLLFSMQFNPQHLAAKYEAGCHGHQDGWILQISSLPPMLGQKKEGNKKKMVPKVACASCHPGVPHVQAHPEPLRMRVGGRFGELSAFGRCCMWGCCTQLDPEGIGKLLPAEDLGRLCLDVSGRGSGMLCPDRSGTGSRILFPDGCGMGLKRLSLDGSSIRSRMLIPHGFNMGSGMLCQNVSGTGSVMLSLAGSNRRSSMLCPAAPGLGLRMLHPNRSRTGSKMLYLAECRPGSGGSVPPFSLTEGC